MDQVETRLQDAKLGSAVDNAARDLPCGWTINLQIEQGSAWVVLDGPDGESTTDFPREFLADEINEAVEHAKKIESRPSFKAQKGNVIRRTSGGKYVARNEHETEIGCELVCSQPHEDGDFSYVCGSDYCRCMQ